MQSFVKLTVLILVLDLFLLIALLVSNPKPSFKLLGSKLDNSDQTVEKPIIFAITPTYARPLQKAELTKQATLVSLVPNLFWVIVEDAEENTVLVRNLIARMDLNERTIILHARTPEEHRVKPGEPYNRVLRGVAQRNKGLEWIVGQLKDSSRRFVIYFMDDDNVYSPFLFEEMEIIKPGRVGVWPVGFSGQAYVETPICNSKGFVTGFRSFHNRKRPFQIDMSGFAISGKLLMRYPEARFRYDTEHGFQESSILRQVYAFDKMQCMADNCRKILVWHTRTMPPDISLENEFGRLGKRSDDNMEI